MKLVIIILIFHLLVLAISITLGWYVSAPWFLIAALFGVNLIQSAFTGVCPVTSLFKSIAEEKSVPPKP